ncbi:MAG TPA: methyltransferase domain-containing protein [Firmicutes bacterium]|jgi:ubiquinone/menaquinone biosynthesis C-methylase UbiE|nr:methyltransferase domain-containing protein [Bacillota bacterium]HHT43403.1 methyltransferase domain-containing protein [Bacillota bacterium]
MPSAWNGMDDAYSVLARFYDLCMEADYAQWVHYLLALCRHHGHRPEQIIDLGCGTGNLTLPLAQQGFRLTGVDLSKEMIAQAQAKAAQYGLEIPFYAADLTEFLAAGSSFDTAISGCDVLNYVITPEGLQRAFASVYQLLSPGGFWLFDLNSAWKLEEIYGDQSYADLRDDFAYFWDNTYDESSGICTMDLTFFVQTAEGLYTRSTERHRQKLWLPDQIAELCEESGFQLCGSYDFLTLDPVSSHSERWQFILRKKN